MRVIAGKARSMPLKTVEGMDTRPTTDRIKETLFNMCQPYLADSRFLDLFAGSGGIGIEALSRGASASVFVEQNKKAAQCIQENLTFTKLHSQGRVIVSDVLAALPLLEREEPFDFIFMDPPYRKGLEEQVLEYLSRSHLIKSDTWIIVETALGESMDYLEEMGFSILKTKTYKTNQHVFITISEKENQEDSI